MSFYLNIDDISFDNTDPVTDANLKDLSSIDTTNTLEEECEESVGKDMKEIKLKQDSIWSYIKHKFAFPFKFFKSKH